MNLSKAEYLKKKLKESGVEAAFTSPTFNEFTVKVKGSPDGVLKKLLEKKIIGGLNLKKYYPELGNHLLICATEMNSKEEMDNLASGP